MEAQMVYCNIIYKGYKLQSNPRPNSKGLLPLVPHRGRGHRKQTSVLMTWETVPNIWLNKFVFFKADKTLAFGEEEKCMYLGKKGCVLREKTVGYLPKCCP